MLEDPNLVAGFKEQISDFAPHVPRSTHDRDHRYLLRGLFDVIDGIGTRHPGLVRITNWYTR